MDPTALAFALLAGAVAAFNPCGFALLPAYLTMLVAGPGRGSAMARALRFTTGMTVGFVAVFGAFALVVAPLALSIERWLPVVTIVIGGLLLALGGWLLAGRELKVPRLIGRGRAPSTSWASQVGYGMTFAVASLSCTVGPFLAVTTGALRTASPLGVAAGFVAYAVGMGAVVGVLAVAVATASGAVTTRMRRLAPMVSRFSGLLLLGAGGYVAWYGWFELRVLGGQAVDDPVVSAAVGVQARLTQLVAGLGAGGVGLAALAVVLMAALASRGAIRTRASR
jgi:cytochrome c-type biogenesis protein